MKLSFYQKQIVEATNCSLDEVSEIEDIMQNTILHSTLDWIGKPDFIRYANEAYTMYKFMHSETGKKYLAELRKQM